MSEVQPSSGIDRLCRQLGIETQDERRERLRKRLLKQLGDDPAAREHKLRNIDEELRVIGRRVKADGRLSPTDYDRLMLLASRRLDIAEGSDS